MNPEPTELPIACTLHAGELGEQERRWAELMQRAGTRRVATPDGVELRFAHDATAERELQQLVATERRCCAWADWEIGADAHELVMQARARADGARVLQSMFLSASAP